MSILPARKNRPKNVSIKSPKCLLNYLPRSSSSLPNTPKNNSVLKQPGGVGGVATNSSGGSKSVGNNVARRGRPRTRGTGAGARGGSRGGRGSSSGGNPSTQPGIVQQSHLLSQFASQCFNWPQLLNTQKMYIFLSICISIFNFEVLKMDFKWDMTFLLILAPICI